MVTYLGVEPLRWVTVTYSILDIILCTKRKKNEKERKKCELKTCASGRNASVWVRTLADDDETAMLYNIVCPSTII